MKPSRRILAVLLVTLVVGGLAATYWLLHLYQPVRVSYDFYQEVKIGMTRAEVEQILGPPADDPKAALTVHKKSWDFGEERFDRETLRYKMIPPGPDWSLAVWISDEANITVYYNPEGKVAMVTIRTADPDNTWKARFRRRLGL